MTLGARVLEASTVLGQSEAWDGAFIMAPLAAPVGEVQVQGP